MPVFLLVLHEMWVLISTAKGIPKLFCLAEIFGTFGLNGLGKIKWSKSKTVKHAELFGWFKHSFYHYTTCITN